MGEPNWARDAERRLGETFARVTPLVSPSTSSTVTTPHPAYAIAAGNVRWALWCVESLYELRDLADLDDARGDSLTPLGHRSAPAAMGQVMWTCVTAMGAFDRVAAAFGALHLGVKTNGTLHDFAELWDKRSQIKDCPPVRQWLRNVRADSAYRDMLALLRHPMTHRTTNMAYFASAGPMAEWSLRPPHHDAPQFYVDAFYTRSLGVDELLREVTPSAERHVLAAVALIESGDALPQQPCPSEA